MSDRETTSAADAPETRVGVAALPKAARVEIVAVVALP